MGVRGLDSSSLGQGQLTALLLMDRGLFVKFQEVMYARLSVKRA